MGGRGRAPRPRGPTRSTRSPRRWPSCAPPPARTTRETLRREAHMRQVLRAAAREGFARIAVVCGAWHAPALRAGCPPRPPTPSCCAGCPKAKADADLGALDPLAAGGRVRLRRRASRPRAGTHHLFDAPRTRRSRAGSPGSPASCAPTTCRCRPRTSSSRSGSPRRSPRCADGRWPGSPRSPRPPGRCCATATGSPLDLVTREAVVGEALGEVPDGVPTVPLDTDLRSRARTLRLKFEATAKVLTLDLRKPGDLAKSHLLRQLRILGVPLGHARPRPGPPAPSGRRGRWTGSPSSPFGSSTPPATGTPSRPPPRLPCWSTSARSRT